MAAMEIRQREAVTELPVIDLSPFFSGADEAGRKRVGSAIRKACTDIGFFYLTGHGIPESELTELVAWGHRFFELPLEVKLAIQRPGGAGGQDGYGNSDRPVDIKERYSISRDAIPGEPAQGNFGAGGTVWPGAGILPGFEAFMRAHIGRRVEVARLLARALALSLDLAEDYFDAMYRHPGAQMLLNYYPATAPDELAGKGQWSFSPHTDYGAFTILSQDFQGGLQAMNSAGAWLDVPPLAGSFVVNLGDMFGRWTNDIYASTLHRVMNVSGKARVSASLFTYPQGMTVIRCLETCHGPGNPPRYEPVVAEEYNRLLAEHAHRTGQPGISARTAERLGG